jgi:lipooligosaccharide transport system ATP-binding protein
MSAAAPALEVDRLVKVLGGARVVDELGFALEAGECLGIIGPNGAGKTTTIKLCLGLATPDGGSIRALGHAIPQQADQARARIGVVSQFDSLDPDFTVAENILVFGRYFGLRDADIEAKLSTLLEFAALSSKSAARIGELSGGMKRRLSLARALVNDPELIFLDEPTTGLDPQARHVMWERLQQLVAQGRSILLTTHFMDEAERLCNRLLVLDHGRALALGRPRELIAAHLEPEVVEIYGPGRDAAVARVGARLPGLRGEASGETHFFYTADARALLDALAGAEGIRYVHRPANLEDLFLRLTGRQLRDD